MKKVMFHAGVFVLLLQSAVLRVQATTPKPRLTQAQAIQIAVRFCRAVAAPISGKATAVYAAPSRYKGMQNHYYLPYRSIRLGTLSGVQVEIEVADATRTVIHFYNYALSQQLMSQRRAVKSALPKNVAIRKATFYLKAIGRVSDIGQPRADKMQITSPATPAGSLWTVRWPRQYRGIPYRNQQLTMIMQAESGALEALSTTFPSPPPIAQSEKVTQQKATAIAVAQLRAVKLKKPVLQGVQRSVVQPNTFWKNRSATPRFNARGVVVWDCFYRTADGIMAEVWIDTHSGQVVGGETYGVG